MKRFSALFLVLLLLLPILTLSVSAREFPYDSILDGNDSADIEVTIEEIEAALEEVMAYLGLSGKEFFTVLRNIMIGQLIAGLVLVAGVVIGLVLHHQKCRKKRQNFDSRQGPACMPR